MASQFIGLHMLVTLKEPVGMQLKGTISDITIADPSSGRRGIVLSNGEFLRSRVYGASSSRTEHPMLTITF